MFSSFATALLLLNFSYCFCKNYSNYTLYRGIPLNEDHLKFLNNLTKSYNANYWKPPGSVNTTVQFMIGPDMKKPFLRAAEERDFLLTTVIEDVQSAFDQQTVKNYTRRKTETFDWQSYFRLKDIYSWMKDLAKANPNSMKVMKIGKSYENRDILVAKISHPGSEKRSSVIVEGGIHAREWIAPCVVTYFLDVILKGPKSKNNNIRKISNLYEFFFVPVLNPDGYEYTHTNDRAWRKNRNGLGVDLNRNFGIAFGTVGVEKDRKEETYCGPEAFSERESTAMANLVKTKSDTLEFYFAFHSYGQYIIIPYAYSRTHHENYDQMKQICEKAANKIKERHNTKYKVGTAYDTVQYITSGVSGCWVKKSFGVPYVATFELRDEEQFGFALPPNQIMPTSMETVDGLIYMLEPKTKTFKSNIPHSTKANESLRSTSSSRNESFGSLTTANGALKTTSSSRNENFGSLTTAKEALRTTSFSRNANFGSLTTEKGILRTASSSRNETFRSLTLVMLELFLLSFNLTF